MSCERILQPRPRLPQWTTSRSLATERCAVSIPWEPPRTFTWKSKEREPSFGAGWSWRGREGAGEDETGWVKSRVNVRNLPPHGCSRTSPRRPREGAQGQVRQGGRAARSGAWKQALAGLAGEEGEAQTMGAVHRCRATLGSLGRAPGSGHVTAPELITDTARAGLRLFPPALKLFILQVTPGVCSGSHL